MSKRILLAVALLVFVCGIAKSDIVTFNVTMSGLQEVPANLSLGTAVATATFNTTTGAMSITGSFSGLTGLSSAAHLHGFAAAGTNAGVLFGMSSLTTGATSGTFSGSGTISAGNITNTLNGLTYLNLHSNVFPGGEIRGQLINPVPEPATFAALAIGGVVCIGLRRRFSSKQGT